MCLLAICMSSLEGCLFRYYAHFSVIFLMYKIVLAIYIFLILTPYQSYHLQIFSPIH